MPRHHPEGIHVASLSLGESLPGKNRHGFKPGPSAGQAVGAIGITASEFRFFTRSTMMNSYKVGISVFLSFRRRPESVRLEAGAIQEVEVLLREMPAPGSRR
jgi:hypothetical protein